jgi:xylulokinase
VQLVAGLDVGGSSVKAWVAEVGGGVVAQDVRALPSLRPAPDRVEMDPDTWAATCREALTAAAVAAPAGDWLGLTVSTLRQGFVLLGADGGTLGRGVLNSDRRGAAHADVLRGHYATTGHWPAPELTLPKLLAVRAEEPERWAATRRVLFLHDWLVARMTGVQATELSYACAGGMADVGARDWARDLLQDSGVPAPVLAPTVEAGTVVGELRPDWGVPATLPVVAGCGDTQLAAMGVGGLADGVLTVVAGSSTPVQAATAERVHDPLGRPWVSTHAAPGLWAVEGNAGYPGSLSGWWSSLVAGDDDGAVDRDPGLVAATAVPYWSQETWERRPPASLLGLGPATTSLQVRQALLEAHAFGVRGNVEDLERVLGRPATAVVVCGGAAADGRLPALLAQVLGREVHVADGVSPAAAAGTALVARAVGAHAHLPALPPSRLPAGDPGPWQEPYDRWTRTVTALRRATDDGPDAP